MLLLFSVNGATAVRSVELRGDKVDLQFWAWRIATSCPYLLGLAGLWATPVSPSRVWFAIFQCCRGPLLSFAVEREEHSGRDGEDRSRWVSLGMEEPAHLPVHLGEPHMPSLV